MAQNVVDYSPFHQVYLINWHPLHESICHNKCVISNSPNFSESENIQFHKSTISVKCLERFLKKRLENITNFTNK